MEIPQIPLPTGGYQVPTKEDLDRRPVETTSAEATAASFEAAKEDTLGGIAARIYVNHEVNAFSQTKLSPEDANSRYPDMPQPFREPISPYLAAWQHTQHQDRQELQAKIDYGPTDKWTKTKMTGAGLVAHAMDPLEFGAGMATGWGAGALIGRTAWGARLALAARPTAEAVALGAVPSTGARIGIEALEAGTGNLIQNAGQEALGSVAKAQEGEAPESTSSTFANLAVNTLAGTVMHLGLKEVGYRAGKLREKLPVNENANRLRDLTNTFDEHLKAQGEPGQFSDPEVFRGNTRARMLDSTSPEASEAIARATVGNLSQDIRPDPAPMLEALARETDVNPGDFGHTRYDYIPVTKESIPSKPFFTSTREATADLSSSTHAPVGDNYGMGVTLTDNPGVANAAAVRSMADKVGAVHEVTANVQNPLDLRAPVPENLTDLVQKVMTHLDEEMPTNMKDALDIMQVAVDEGDLAPDFMQKMSGHLQEQGYDALLSDGSSRLGVDHSPHNVLEVLDPEKVEQKSVFEPDKDMIRQPTKEEIQKLNDRMTEPNHILYDKEAVEKFIQESEELATPKANRTQALREAADQAVLELEDLKNQGHFDASELKILEQIKREIGDQDLRDKLLVNAAACVRL